MADVLYEAHQASCQTSKEATCLPGGAAALNIDENAGAEHSLSFDTDSHALICDNSANVHVCNDKRMYVGEIRS